VKSLLAGKHVLLEKPSVSNATEAMALFRHPIFAQPDAPVLLEAFHSRFHPAFCAFLDLLDPPNIVYAHSSAKAPLGYVSLDDIRFNYDLAGGSCMDPGTYTIMTLREMLGTEPEECLEAIPRMLPKSYDQKCDKAITAKFRFPNGALGEIDVDLREAGISTPSCSAVHREVDVPDTKLASEEEHVCVRTVILTNYMVPHVWHRIDTKETHTVRSIKGKKTIKAWTETSSKKAYTWEDVEKKGDPSWSTYRYQLEEFVNRVRGREGSGVWMDGEDSIRQMMLIDSVYEKSGLPRRPTSTYCK
jgi:predicted dehydrogenase